VARSRTPLSVIRRRRLQQLARLGIAQPGMLPSLPLAIGLLTPLTGLPDAALRSQSYVLF
jgi:hypothetical protein